MGDEGFIGVFDSGAGGVSVLARLAERLPRERFVYFGDSANTPYGEKGADWVRERSLELAGDLVERGAKAIVIACNTATSAAAPVVRETYPDMPVVGVEPALKPAALALSGKDILVMATPMTLALEKFQHLADVWGEGCTVHPCACAGLAARIEQGNLDSPDLAQMLEDLVGGFRGRVDGVVLGCTHYPFVADRIRAVVGDVPFFDGADGTARQLERQLSERGLSCAEGQGSVSFETSATGSQAIDLYRRLFAAASSL